MTLRNLRGNGEEKHVGVFSSSTKLTKKIVTIVKCLLSLRVKVKNCNLTKVLYVRKADFVCSAPRDFLKALPIIRVNF